MQFFFTMHAYKTYHKLTEIVPTLALIGQIYNIVMYLLYR